MYIRYANEKKKIYITYGVRIYEKYIIFFVYFMFGLILKYFIFNVKHVLNHP
jgi:hypothetical protein